MKRFFVCGLLFFFNFIAIAQKKVQRLIIGDKIPASVWDNISDSKPAKLTILDFWSTGCTSCMEAFPKMEKLKKQFAGNLEVILVNPWETDGQVKVRINKMNELRRKNNIATFALPTTLRTINGDTIYKQLFPAITVPHHVWVNAKGIVLHITGGYNAYPQNVDAVLKGEKVNMILKDDIAMEALMKKGFVQPTLAKMPTVYYSAFIPYFGGDAHYPDPDDSSRQIFRFAQYNVPVTEFFKSAFVDQTHTRMILEMKNKEQYQYPDYRTQGYRVDDWSRKYLFSYELQIPLSEKDTWRQKMQQDINYFFGNKFNIEGVIEKRKFKSFVLIQTKKGVLTSSGRELDIKEDKNSSIWVNYPFKGVISVFYELEDLNKGRIFVNETGIDPSLNVDMEINGDVKNIENIRKQLQRYGLDIIAAEREVDVVVVRDKFTSPTSFF